MDPQALDTAIESALTRLGYENLRPMQKLAVQSFVQGQDVFVSLPTGSGKSLCYWLLPSVFEHLRDIACCTVIVVSPLDALMKDQEHSLQERGVKAIKVGVDDARMEDVKKGCYELLLVSPELLLTSSEWRDMLQSTVQLVGVVVDEAHCVKKWGKNFRREFSHLGEVRSLVSSRVQIMALTATATRQSREDICRTLGMTKPVVVSQSPNKRNITYELLVKRETVEETLAPLVEQLRRERNTMERVLIFCQKYDDVTHIYHFMRSRLGNEGCHPMGAPNLVKYRLFDMFTSCTHPSVKEGIVSAFTNINSPLRIVIATIAFGMGLDCPNINKVIHWGPPSDIESYLQETGRAGRDGAQATATLYYNKTDLRPQHIEDSVKLYCRNTDCCRRELILRDFDDCVVRSPNQESECVCLCCDVCCTKCKCHDTTCN